MDAMTYDPSKSEQWNVARGNVVTVFCRHCDWRVTVSRIGTACDFMDLHSSMAAGHMPQMR